jgi:hypothetical protein
MRRYKSSRDKLGGKKRAFDPESPMHYSGVDLLHGNDTLHRRIESFPVAIDNRN